jgi:hypothetical protein
MRASLLLIFALVVLALAKPITREKVQCAQRAFDRHYTSQHPYSNYISSTAVQEDNGEFVIFVTLWQEPPASLALPQSYRGVKVIYHLESVVCTMEAKMCPDGSYVGRTGPHCAFAPCPNENQNSTSSTGHSVVRMRMAVFVLSFTIFSAVCFSLCMCCCAAIARRRKCRMANAECDLESLESLAEHVETQQPDQATVVPQAQPQPIYYYAPYPQAPVVNQAPYGAYPYMMPMQAPMVPQHAAFQPMSDEEYARQLQAQINNEH